VSGWDLRELDGVLNDEATVLAEHLVEGLGNHLGHLDGEGKQRGLELVAPGVR